MRAIMMQEASAMREAVKHEKITAIPKGLATTPRSAEKLYKA
jgi:hypothetical protein